MHTPSRKALTAIATVSALAAGGAALAGAATNSGSTSSSSSSAQRAPMNELSGEKAAKVKAVALAEVSGGTVLRVQAGGPNGAAYHAHVRKSDGTEVVVLVNSNFEATGVEEMMKRP